MKKIFFLLPVGALIAAAVYASKSWTKPVDADITSPFGYRINPITNASELHNGIDLGVPEGTVIVSPFAGTVTKVYENDKGGRQMIIQHTNGFSTGYAHLSDTLVGVGDTVKKGQEIAHSGNTGNTTGAHLHFVLLDSTGTAIDPQGVIYPKT